MAASIRLSSFVEITDQLKQHCAQGNTGTLSLATSENHHATISLKGGEVVGVAYRQFKGEAALEKIRQIRAARCSFVDGMLRTTETDFSLPSSDELLDYLGVSAQAPAVAVDDNTRAAIEAEATEYFGPMAATICEEHIALGGDLNKEENLLQVLDSIAAEVGDAEKAARLKQGVLNRLKG